MPLDKWIAALFLAGALLYGFAAFEYPLLPFERHMSFKPNTWPTVLSVAAVILSFLILVSPRKPAAEGTAPEIDLSRLGDYKVGQALLIVLSMILFAVALRPVGFLAATTLFLVATGMILGERNFKLLVPVAIGGAVFVWLVVQEALGIFLRPFPSLMS
ncbi:tripartite tricarboxylate transporter TctB family protein [Nisaea sp.]|uniref:tripartite tricarboxylate transporter TctB family protein n=1 Tax=Nisaea sp. TaxID=2024842 RepID=UPI0032EFF37A